MALDGYTTIGDDILCKECDERIEQGEKCIEASHAEVGKNEVDSTSAIPERLAGVWHPECFNP